MGLPSNYPAALLRTEADAGDVQPDAGDHVLRGEVQRLAVVTELAVRRRTAVVDETELLAVLREHHDSAGRAREHGAVRGDGDAVGQSGRAWLHHAGDVGEQFLARDVAVLVERIGEDD